MKKDIIDWEKTGSGLRYDSYSLNRTDWCNEGRRVFQELSDGSNGAYAVGLGKDILFSYKLCLVRVYGNFHNIAHIGTQIEADNIATQIEIIHNDSNTRTRAAQFL